MNKGKGKRKLLELPEDEEPPQLPREDPDNNFNVYVGSEGGILRGVHFGPDLPAFTNCIKGWHGSNKPIVCLAWADKEEKEILVGMSNHVVKVFDVKLRAFTQIISLEIEETKPMISLSQYEDNFLCGFESGIVSLWNFISFGSVLNIKTGNHLSKVKRCEADEKFIATGGNKNNLKIWDIENPDKPIYAAKNLPNDELDLEVPVWVQDMTFMPQSSEILSVCSRYGEVMMYDIRAQTKNRPVAYLKYYDHPCMSISSTTNDKQVLVGSAKGHVSLLDFRNPKKVTCARSYKGFVGSIRSIVSSTNCPYFLSSGLDSHIYLHDIKEREPVKKLWLKDKISSILITKDFQITHPSHAEFAKTELLLHEVLIKPRSKEAKKIKVSLKN